MADFVRVERLGVVGARLEEGVLDGFLSQDPEQGLLLVQGGARRRALRAELVRDIEAGRSVPVYTLGTLPRLVGSGPGVVPRIGALARFALVEDLLVAGALGDAARTPGPGLVREATRLLDELRLAGLGGPEEGRGEAAPELARGLAFLEAYRARLGELGLEDGPARLARVTRWLEELPARKGVGDWGGGYLGLEVATLWAPLERRAVKALARLARRVEVIHPDPPTPGVTFERTRRGIRDMFPRLADRALEPGEPPGPLLSHLFERLPEPAPCDRVLLAEPGSRAGEVEAAAGWIRGLVERGVVGDLSRVAIVLASPREYLPLLDELLGEHGLPVHDDLARPLEDARVVETLLNLLEAVAHGLPRRQLVELLRSPFVDLAAAGIGELDAELLDQAARLAGLGGAPAEWVAGLERLAAQLLAEPAAEAGAEEPAARRARLDMARRVGELPAAVGRALAILEPVRTARGRAFPAAFEEALARLGVLPGILAGPDPAWSAREAAALRAFLDLLGELATTEAAAGRSMDLGRIERLVRTALPGATYRTPHATPAGIQVLTVGAASQGAFDAMVLLGACEGSFPGGGMRPPVHGGSRALRRALRDLPAYAEDERERFYLLLSACAGPILVTRPREEAGVPLLPAHYLEVLRRTVTLGELPAPGPWPAGARRFQETLAAGLLEDRPEAHAVVGEMPGARPWARALAVQHARTTAEGARFRGILEDPRLRAMVRAAFPVEGEFGITALEDFAQCPFRFFARRVLGMDEREELAEDVDARVRGDLVHRILHDFLARRGRRVDAADLEDARGLLREVGEAHFGGAGTRGFYWDQERERLLGSGEVRGVLEEWLELEAERPAAFRPALLEWAFGEKAGRPVSVGVEGEDPVHLRGQIDRVDLLDGGGFVVWDYKTGSVFEPIEKLRAGILLQLPLYLLAVLRRGGDVGEPWGAAYLRVGREGQVGPSGAFGDAARVGPKGTYPLFSPRARRTRTKDGWPLGEAGDPDLAGWLEVVARRTVDLADRLRRGRFFAFRHPQQHDCVERCPYRDVCRVEEGATFHDHAAEALPADPDLEVDA